MERRNLVAGLTVIASSFLLLAGTASNAAAAPGPSCTVKSLPSFVAQGESQFGTPAMVADVIEISCNPSVYSTGLPVSVSADQLYKRCGGNLKWIDPNDEGSPKWGYGSSFDEIHLDVDGNANVVAIGGPQCMPGESLITLDQEKPPYETFTTSFQVLPSKPTAEGLTILPESQVEDANSSGVIAIAEVEMPEAGEEAVRIGAPQLYDRCHGGFYIIGQGPDQWTNGKELLDAIHLDNDGNGFAILKGTDSCLSGSSLIEADGEENYVTLKADFQIEQPMVRFGV
jgi:hypothetical protein